MFLLAHAIAFASSIDRSPIDRVVKRHYEQIRYCYEKELPRRPTLQGRLVVRFRLELDGTLTEAAVVESTLADTVVEECVVARFREWDWPESNSVYIVRYPLSFKVEPRRRG